MGYRVIDPAAVDPTPAYPCLRRSIAEAAGLAVLALAVYEVAPGEDLAATYHVHDEREEAFYVVSGTLHVETPAGEYAIEAGEVFAVEPANPIRPFVPADAPGPAVVLGMGAPAYDFGRAFDPD